MAMFTITLINMTDGSVQGHIGSCADIKKNKAKKADAPWTFEVYSKQDAWESYNSDFLYECGGGDHEADCDPEHGECVNAYRIDWLPCASHVPHAMETVVEPEPTAQPMNKTEAYAFLRRAREGVRDAGKVLIYKEGTAEDLREQLLEVIGSATHLLDALEGDGIKGF